MELVEEVWIVETVQEDMFVGVVEPVFLPVFLQLVQHKDINVELPKMELVQGIWIAEIALLGIVVTWVIDVFYKQGGILQETLGMWDKEQQESTMEAIG